jgi:hypothetical protein
VELDVQASNEDDARDRAWMCLDYWTHCGAEGPDWDRTDDVTEITSVFQLAD